MEQSFFINGKWRRGKAGPLVSYDKSIWEPLWSGHSAERHEVAEAVGAAQGAFASWKGLGLTRRYDIARRYAEILGGQKEELSLLLAKETGKPLWECRTELEAMIAKVDISYEAYHKRSGEESFAEGPAQQAHLRFRPHGVVGVLGPYNMPGHLPNGHIVPALLAGNTVVFKPSELTPLSGQWLVEAWQQAGLPPGVLNLVQGERETGQALAEHPDLAGLFFTGSVQGGRALHKAFAGRPETILALEMGGNNPLIAWEVADHIAAAYLILESAYISSGQRCTCARRLLLPQGPEGDEILTQLQFLLTRLRVGFYYEQPEPFMGPVISKQAAQGVLNKQKELMESGAIPLVPVEAMRQSENLLSPGLMDVTAAQNRPDEEIFGPLLQVLRLADFDAALDEANNTRFGLAAGLITDNKELYRTFEQEIRAGIVNFNRKTTGASSRLPFGGVGWSGNHRPSAAFAADYCAYPVASLERDKPSIPQKISPGIEGIRD